MLGVLLAVDLLAHDGNGLLIDGRGVPALDGAIVGLSALIALAALPTVTHEELGGGGKCAFLACLLYTSDAADERLV